MKKPGRFYVYILECADGTYYTGYTNDLDARTKRHNIGLASKYTRAKLPVRVVWKKQYKYRHYAMSAEYKIKRLNKRQKESLIKGRCLGKVLAVCI